MAAADDAMHYVGLDVHAKRSALCILDGAGRTVKQMEVRGGWPVLLERVEREVPRPFSVCFEASCGYGYLHGRLSRLAHSVAVAHPGQLRLIFKSKKKNDRVDAAKIAKLLYLDAVPRAHVPSADVRAWRGLIEYRQRLMGRR
jgi:transposase